MRAIAVVAVIVYHVHNSALPAGYFGVDVFFVISGYVISGVLLREYARTKRLDLFAFWCRRIRRLAPALLLVLATVLLLSPVLLERISGEVGILAKSALAVLLINQNHYLLYMSSDYFSELSEHNPLLHMWSLSVEEQYYFFWPFLLLTLLKILGKRLLTVLSVLALGSTFAFITISQDDPQRAFYLMPSRAWELIAGAVVAVGVGSATPARIWKKSATALGVLAFVVVIFCMVFRSASNSVLIALNILLVCGTALLIASGSLDGNNPVTRLLGSRWLCYLGKVSYPLYLWHWPLLVMTRSTRLYESNLVADILCALLALLMAIATYELVEKQSWRAVQSVSTVRMVCIASGTAVAVAIGALVLGAWARFGWGYDTEERVLDASRRDRAETGCMFDQSPTAQMIDACLPHQRLPFVLLWGDSHAEQWAPTLSALGVKKGVGVAVLTMRGCRPLPREVRNDYCGEFNAMVLSKIRVWSDTRGLRGVLIAGRWSDGLGIATPSVTDIAFPKTKFYDTRATSRQQSLRLLEGAMAQLLDELTASRIRVMLVADSPIQRYDVQHCIARLESSRCFVSRSEFSNFSGAVDAIFARESLRRPMVRVQDPKLFMCDQFICPAIIDDMIVYSDDDHVTAAFAVASAKQFAENFDWLVGR